MKRDFREGLYLSKQAGAFCGMPQRTVQARTEDGCIVPAKDTRTGTGDRRSYSILNCIELGIIKSLSDRRVSLKRVKGVMNHLRRDSRLERLLAHDRAYLVLQLESDPRVSAPQISFMAYGRDEELNLQGWRYSTEPGNVDSVLIVNVGRIAKRVLESIG